MHQTGHTQPIKAIEFTQFNGLDVVFTGGLEGKVKAWTIDRVQNLLTPIDEKDFGGPINCLQMLPNNVLVAGVGTGGQMPVWNLNENQFTAVPAHSVPITAMFRFNQYLVTGDSQGDIQVRDATTASLILQLP